MSKYQGIISDFQSNFQERLKNTLVNGIYWNIFYPRVSLLTIFKLPVRPYVDYGGTLYD